MTTLQLDPSIAKILPEGWEGWPLADKYRLLWILRRRPKQTAPAWEWFIWLLLAGRGFGKTETGAQWCRERGVHEQPGSRGALIGPTLGHVRDTMVEGETGLLTILPPSALINGAIEDSWNRSLTELTLANGTHIKCFGAEKPGRLRGPQHHWAWGDEPAEWQDAKKGISKDTTFDNIMFGLRLGEDPRLVLTGTPKNVTLVRQLVWVKGDPKLGRRTDVAVTRGRTSENLKNLSPVYHRVIAQYVGTRLGLQELEGEILEDVEGALWTAAMVEADRIWFYPQLPPMLRIVVAVDPSGSAEGAEVGIIVAGLGSDGHCYILADLSGHYSPAEWGDAVVRAYVDWEADRIVGERNFGGDMVEHVIATVPSKVHEGHGDTLYPAGTNLPYKDVHASRGKVVRAEPIQGLSQQHRLHIYNRLLELEDQMTTWVPDAGMASPDRLDAMVWAATELMLEPEDVETMVEYEDLERPISRY